MAAKKKRKWPSSRYAKRHSSRTAVPNNVKWQFVTRWMTDMYDWGRLVRQDIMKLEKEVDYLRRHCCHLPPVAWGTAVRKLGDPGDPPPPPPPPKLS